METPRINEDEYPTTPIPVVAESDTEITARNPDIPVASAYAERPGVVSPESSDEGTQPLPEQPRRGRRGARIAVVLGVTAALAAGCTGGAVLNGAGGRFGESVREVANGVPLISGLVEDEATPVEAGPVPEQATQDPGIAAPTTAPEITVPPEVTEEAEPTEPPAEDTTASPSESDADWEPRFPGDPNPLESGMTYWGAAHSGNGDVSGRHEEPTGASLALHRTYYHWDDIESTPDDYMYNMVRSDHEANRLPVVSVKPPNWREMAEGMHDDELDGMLAELDSYGKPVWLVVHHEPEGGGGRNYSDDQGGPEAFRDMQRHVRERMTELGTENIAFMPVFMAYDWDPRSGRDPNEWWVDDVWDAVLIDHYQQSEEGDMFSGEGWQNFQEWIDEKQVPYGLAEWANTGTDSAAAEEMTELWSYATSGDHDFIAASYFDSEVTTRGEPWLLEGEPLEQFHQILAEDPHVMRIDELPN